MLTWAEASPQRVIYSRAVILNIPGKEVKKDSVEVKHKKLENNDLSLINNIDSFVIDEKKFSTEVLVNIDTIAENGKSFQISKFTFQPIWKTSQNISDYPSGSYLLKSSSVSNNLTNNVKETLQKKIFSFINKNDSILIKIKGSADATIIKRIRYKNEFGNINDQFYFNDTKKDIHLTKNEFLTQNEELAFLRTLGIKNFLEENIPELQNFNINFGHYIEVSEKTGGIYRRVSIEVILKHQI